LEAERRQQEMEKQQADAMRRLRPGRSPDAEAFARQAEQQFEEDSLRADARTAAERASEALLRRLPAALDEEAAAFERQAARLLRHPLLRSFRETHAGRPGRLAAALAGALRRLCAESGPSAPAGGLGALDDPVLLALLDVGLFVPSWTQDSGPSVRCASCMQRMLLLAWAEALSEELPWRHWLECRWQLWRTPYAQGAVTDSATPRPPADTRSSHAVVATAA